MPGLISTREAALLVGVSARRIRQYVDDGRLTGVEVAPGRIQVPRDQAEALARAPRRPGPVPKEKPA